MNDGVRLGVGLGMRLGGLLGRIATIGLGGGVDLDRGVGEWDRLSVLLAHISHSR